VKDLKERGLLDDTLVILGRRVWPHPVHPGRHHRYQEMGARSSPLSFTTWMAGGGTKPGITYGETDEFAFNVTQDPVHVPISRPPSCTCSASIMRNSRSVSRAANSVSTDVHGNVVKPLIS